MATIGLKLIILGLKHLSEERLKYYVWKNTFKDLVSSKAAPNAYFFSWKTSLSLLSSQMYSIPVFQIHS